MSEAIGKAKRCELCPDDAETCYCYDDKPSVYLTESQLDEIVKEFVKPAVSENDRKLKMTVLSLVSDLRNCRAEYAEERAAHNAHVTELIELEYKIGELDNYHRMLHARNERLEKELRDAKVKIAVLERDNDMLESSYEELVGKLDQSMEALEWIRDAGTDYQSINKARQAIQQIKGEK